jgi:hypothetical protein
MPPSTLRTNILLSVSGIEIEPECVVKYRHIRAEKGTLYEPGNEETVEIDGITVIVDGKEHPLPYWLVDQLGEAGLIAECLADWRGEDERAREEAAEFRRAELHSVAAE